MVIMVARGDELHVNAIGTHAFAPASRGAAGTPMRRDTIFRVGSLTKPVLAVATLMLAEEGLLDLAGPVDRWLPELADRRVLRRVDGPLDDTVPARRPITIDDLLTFRMGFGIITEPSYNPPFPIVSAANELRLTLSEPDPRTPHPPEEWIKLFGTLPLMYQPGERWQYNAGSLVLGVLLARAAGAGLDEVLRARVFEPLGMVDTGFWTSIEDTARIPTHYMSSFGGGRLEPQPLSAPQVWSTPPAFPSGAGGLLSTADDYLTFARLLRAGGMHHGRRLLAAEFVARMTTNRLAAEQIASAGALLEPAGWGYGLAVSVAPDHISAQPGWYGWDGGYGTVWFTDPHRDLIALALTQVSDFLFNGGREEFGKLAAQAAAG